jgi:hypothetical protein
MRMRKIYAALILASLATGVSAQTTAQQSTANDASQGRIQVAQAGSGPNSQGPGQGGQGGPGKAPGGSEHHHGPPPAAIAACKGLAAGAGCSFVGRNNQNRTGTCFSPAADKPLACRPERGGRGGQGGPGAAKG